MQRRELFTSLIWGVALMAVNTVFAWVGRGDTPNQVEMILSNTLESPEYEKTLWNIWASEMNFLISYFGKPSGVKFWEIIQELKEVYHIETGLENGIITSKWLKNIYLQVYMPNREKLDFERLKRLEIYEDMLGYQKRPKALSRKLDPFAYNTYYGKWSSVNVENTFVSQDLMWVVPNELLNPETKIIIGKVGEKVALMFYIEGRLHLATYVSPGTGRRTPRVALYGERNAAMLHYSSKYPTKTNGWAVMPYATHITWPIWMHGSDDVIDGTPRSHGCIRTPLFYVKEVYEQVSKLGKENVLIDTKGIY